MTTYNVAELSCLVLHRTSSEVVWGRRYPTDRGKEARPLRSHPRGSTGKRRAANTLFVSSVPFLQNRAERQRRAVSARTVRRYDSIIAENP